MHIAFVVPYCASLYSVPPIGLGYVAAAVRREVPDARISLVDAVKDRLDPPRFRRWVERERPDVVAFQMFSSDYHAVEQMLAVAREVDPSIVTVAGGAHPSAVPAETLQAFPKLDYAFRGEGEVGFPQLVQRLMGVADHPLETMAGLVWRDHDALRVNPPALVRDLDALGQPAWDLMDPRQYRDAPSGVLFADSPVAPIVTSRGCPFSCTFCASHAVMGRAIRTRSVDHVVAEIDRLQTDFGVREIHIEDDNFTAKRTRVLAFCEAVRRRRLRFTLAFPNGVRLDTLDEEMLVALRDIGCYAMSVGIESGHQRVLDSIRKKLELQRVREQVALIHRTGIQARGFFILGFPTETREEMLATIEFARSLDIAAAQFSTFVPLPGTAAAAQLAADGLLDGFDWDRLLYHRSPYVPPDITPREFKNIQRWAYLRFYLRPRIVAGLLGQIQSPSHVVMIARRLVGYLL